MTRLQQLEQHTRDFTRSIVLDFISEAGFAYLTTLKCGYCIILKISSVTNKLGALP